ncbi:MAG: YggS family pyridoxal phosphate-dependent enzyme [Oscillospiraceae bacterium]
MTEKSCDIGTQVRRIREHMTEEALRWGRDPSKIALMAVTKNNSAERVNESLAAGIMLLGENRAQELLAKYDDYHLTQGCQVHFIGHLQTNKVRHIIDKVDLVQSLDRMSLALELNQYATAQGRVLPVLVEVNVAGELSKSGIKSAEIETFVRKIAVLSHLSVRGLMTVPPAGVSERETEGYFDTIHRHFIDIITKNIDNVSMELLSMGMSYDYPLAIKHGSNIIRIGRGIFGERL